jgi:hypothetical protein
MTGPRVTKDSFVLPMRAEGDESFGLLSPMTTQNLFDGARQIVVFQTPEDPVKVMERHLVRFQKCLLRRSLIGPVIGRSAGHTPHCEELQCTPLPIDFGDCFVPIDLGFFSVLVALHDHHLTPIQAQSQFLLLHVFSDCSLAELDARHLFPDSDENSMRGVMLFAWLLFIFFQNLLDELFDLIHLRLRSLRCFPVRRDGIGNGLSDHSSMHPVLPGNGPDRLLFKLIGSPYSLEQLHLGSPIQ